LSDLDTGLKLILYLTSLLARALESNNYTDDALFHTYKEDEN